MTIVRFICARLDEVEGAASPAREDAGPGSTAPTGGVLGLKLARVQLMREVIAEHECDRFAQICLTCRRHGSDEGWASESWPCPTVRQVAALWAGHPDYDASWAPEARTRREGAPAVPRQRRASNGTWLRDVSQASSTASCSTESCGS